MTAFNRRSYSGGAVPTVLTSTAHAADTTINVAATTNWPLTATGPFVLVLDGGTATEEAVLCTAYTPTTATVQRGYDGTTAQDHGTNAPVQHCDSATDLDEANQIVNALMGGQSAPATADKILTNLGWGSVAASSDFWPLAAGAIWLGVAETSQSTPDSAGTLTAVLLGTDARSEIIYAESVLTGIIGPNERSALHVTASLSAYLNDSTHDNNVGLFAQNWTANGAGIVVRNYGTGDGIFTSDTGGGNALNVWQGDGTHQSVGGAGINLARFGTGHALYVLTEAGSAGTVVEVANVVDATSLYLNDSAGAKTASIFELTGQALTTGHMMSLFHNGSTWSGNVINANVASGSGSFTGDLLNFIVNGTVKFQVDANGQIHSTGANEVTGAGTAALGANCPAVTPGAPYKWLKLTTSDGSQVYLPAWK